MLISNFGISYPSASLDPIFFANSTYDDHWYYNARVHASVLGCISRTLVCLPRTGQEPPLCVNLTSLGDLSTSEREHGPVRAMLYFSLLLDLSEQLSFMMAEALDAQSLVSGSTSAYIPNDQWKAETRQIFESLLARSQITARNIARGVPGRQLHGQRDLMKPAYQGMCTRYKFRSIGWKNISVAHFLAEFLLGLLFCFIGITREDKELWVERPVKRFVRSKFWGHCATGLSRVKDWWVTHVPKPWQGMCSIATSGWTAIRDAASMCWRDMKARIAQ